MRVIAVIPARYEASRFPGKLMQPLGNKTVIATTYDNVVGTGLFDEVFVATDSQIILEEIQRCGGRALLTGTHETGSDRTAEAVQHLEVDIVINVQGDEPFLKRKPLEQLIEVFRNDADKEISLASLKIKLHGAEEIKNPNNVKVITDLNGFALYFSRSVIPFHREHSLQANYYKHVGVYAFRKNALLSFTNWPQTVPEQAEKLEQLRYLDNGIKIRMVITDAGTIGIDTPGDLEKAKEHLKKVVSNKL